LGVLQCQPDNIGLVMQIPARRYAQYAVDLWWKTV